MEWIWLTGFIMGVAPCALFVYIMHRANKKLVYELSMKQLDVDMGSEMLGGYRHDYALLEAEIKDGWMVSHELMERKVAELEAEIAKLKRIAQDDAEVIGGKG